MEQVRLQARIAEWQARSISSMFVGLAESPKQAKQLAKMVEKMKLPLADEADEIVDTRSDEDIIDQGGKVDLENQPSFEMLTQALGDL